MPETDQPRAEYEFGPADNKTIRSLSVALLFVAGTTQLFGVLVAITGILAGGRAGALGLAEGVLMVVIGAWLLRAASAFDRIVKTRGRDISHLMDALRGLRNVYTVQAVITAAVCLLVLAAMMYGSIAH